MTHASDSIGTSLILHCRSAWSADAAGKSSGGSARSPAAGQSGQSDRPAIILDGPTSSGSVSASSRLTCGQWTCTAEWMCRQTRSARARAWACLSRNANEAAGSTELGRMWAGRIGQAHSPLRFASRTASARCMHQRRTCAGLHPRCLESPSMRIDSEQISATRRESCSAARGATAPASPERLRRWVHAYLIRPRTISCEHLDAAFSAALLAAVAKLHVSSADVYPARRIQSRSSRDVPESVRSCRTRAEWTSRHPFRH